MLRTVWMDHATGEMTAKNSSSALGGMIFALTSVEEKYPGDRRERERFSKYGVPSISWQIRFAAEDFDALSVPTLLEILKVKPSPIVRLALASACQRLTVEQRKPIVLTLLAHEEDKDDANLPLMDWYAAEPIVAADVAWAAEALAACKIPKVSEYIARRMSEK